MHPIQVDDERRDLGKRLEPLGELARDSEVELTDERDDRDVGLLGVDPLYLNVATRAGAYAEDLVVDRLASE